MEIRSLQKADIPQIVSLEKLCFSDPWSENAFLYELNNPLSLWLVAVQEDKILGYIGSQTVLDASDIMNIAVLPENRRQGIGEMLIHALTEELRQRKVKSLCLEVRVSNQAAIALYNKLGFFCAGRRPGYYRHPREDAYILRKEWE